MIPTQSQPSGKSRRSPQEAEMSSGVILGEKSGLSEPQDRALARGRSWERSSRKASWRRWDWATGKYRQGEREDMPVEKTAQATYGNGNIEIDLCTRGQKSRSGPLKRPVPWSVRQRVLGRGKQWVVGALLTKLAALPQAHRNEHLLHSACGHPASPCARVCAL